MSSSVAISQHIPAICFSKSTRRERASSTSSTSIGAMRIPRWGNISIIRDSSLNWITASRTGVRLTPIFAANSISLKASPGFNSREITCSRIIRYAYSLAVSPDLFPCAFMVSFLLFSASTPDVRFHSALRLLPTVRSGSMHPTHGHTGHILAWKPHPRSLFRGLGG